MNEKELENLRETKKGNQFNLKKINELENWFKYEYQQRLSKILRYDYLRIPKNETRYALELEAYTKEQELRALKGEEPLPDLKMVELI